MKRREFFKAGIASLIGASAYSMLIEPNILKLTRLELDLKLKKRLKIFHLTDFLKAVSDSYECYGVIGNHDIWAADKLKRFENALEHIVGIFKNSGVKMLRNEAEYLSRHCLWIAGVDDPFTAYLMDVDKALSMHDDKPKILLAHSPDVIYKVKGRASLILAGHTHGGQIRLPLIGPLWVPATRKYAYGFFNEGKTMMYVSRGLGEILPIRFNCPPEVVEVVLT